MRFFDILFSLFGLIIFFPLFFLIFVIGLFDTGSPLFIQKRVGLNLESFNLIKFRTMKMNTLSSGTHLVDPSNITHFGYFLRKYKLDELLQLWNVFIGNMSLVGPRPNLVNQEELVAVRDVLGVYDVRPGITGLAQIKHIDMSTPELLAKIDAEMISTMSVANYFKYILLTVTGKGQGDRVRG